MREQTITGFAASGVKANIGSPLEVLADQAAEFRREQVIIEKVGASKAQSALQSGKNVATQAKWAGISGAVQGLGTAASILANLK